MTASATYHASRLAGLSCATVVEEGPPRVCVHDRFALSVLTAGETVVWCRGESHVLEPGSVLMVGPGDVHRSLETAPHSSVTVMLRPDLVGALRGRDAETRFTIAVARCPALRAELAALVDSVREREESSAQERRLVRLFAVLSPLWTEATRPEPALVLRTRRALTQSPGTTLSLDELASRLRCTPSYLCRVFSEHTGVGPHAYQLQQRLLEAGRLIEAGRSVARAAKLTGFGDASHLRRHFRRRFGAAPGRYQRELGAAVAPPAA
jgi:AraC-like DNA-binding protein